MPEIIDLSSKSYFSEGLNFADLARMTVGVTYSANSEPFGDLELHDFALPELKLTRQHGRYFDTEEDCNNGALVL